MIKEIIKDYFNGHFVNLFSKQEYSSSFTVKRFFGKQLIAEYTNMKNNRERIIVTFKNNSFLLNVFNKNRGREVFKDKYSNYHSKYEIYNKLLALCNDVNKFKNDSKLFDELDLAINTYNVMKQYNGISSNVESVKNVFNITFEEIKNLLNHNKAVIVKGNKSLDNYEEEIEKGNQVSTEFAPYYDSNRKYRLVLSSNELPSLEKIKI